MRKGSDHRTGPPHYDYNFVESSLVGGQYANKQTKIKQYSSLRAYIAEFT